MPLEAAFASVFDAAQVRLAQLGQTIVEREERGLDTEAEELAVLDLRFGLEVVAQLAPGKEQNQVLGYLIETYGLLAVGTDPFLRPLLPPVPATGGTIVRRVLAINNKALVVNGKLLSLGARLVPAPLTPATL